MRALKAEERDRVADEARLWLRTPYHHQATIRGVGVDCGMLIREVMRFAVGVDIPDPRPYPKDWAAHRLRERLVEFLEAGGLVRSLDSPMAGDVVAVRYGRPISHAAIVTAWPEVVHVSTEEGRCTLADATMQRPFIGREIHVWRVMVP